MTDDPDRLDLDRFLPYLVNVLAGRVSHALARVYEARFSITIAEWRVIAHLAGHRNVSVREIHARMGMDKSKVSRAAATLETAGFVEKSVKAADRRLVELQLTRKGRRLYAEIEPRALAFEAEILSALTPEERTAFLSTVRKLLDATRAGEGPSEAA